MDLRTQEYKTIWNQVFLTIIIILRFKFILLGAEDILKISSYCNLEIEKSNGS